MKPVPTFLFVLIQLFLWTNLHATNYYVSTSGSDANNGLTLATPFATVAKAVSKATVAGDSIIIRSGTYTINSPVSITKSGTAARHIVMTVYLPDLLSLNNRPLLNFSGMSVSSSNMGIKLSGISYWDIYGITIKGAGDNGMLMQNSCHHVKIELCSFTRNRDSGLQIRSGTHHVLVLNCDSYENADLGTGTSTSGGNADGFAPKLDVGDSVIFRGCRAWMNSDDGWDGYLKAIESGYPDKMTTILEDCWAFRNGYYWLDGTTTTSMNGNGFKMGGSDNKDQAHHFVVVRCLSFMNKAKGFDQNGNAGSMYLYNNTAHSNGDYDYGLNSSSVTYAAGAALSVFNCVSYGVKGRTIRTTGGGPISTGNNSFITNLSSNPYYLSLDTTGVTGQRSLDGSLPVLNYMRLAPSSVYIDGGSIQENVQYHDSTGITFYGTKPDQGAFETIAATAYTFNGTGNWTAQSQWLYHNPPPSSLFTGSSVLIDPVITGQCYLNRAVTIPAGCSLTVNDSKQFFIPGELLIQ